jgi:IMP dehydrogenase
MGEWRTAEGESFLVPYKGPVINVLKDIEGGLRSALSYTNSRNLDDFVLNCEFINVSNSVAQESVAHGNKK